LAECKQSHHHTNPGLISSAPLGKVSLASRKFVEFVARLPALRVRLQLKTFAWSGRFAWFAVIFIRCNPAEHRRHNPRIKSGTEVPLPDRHNVRN
jgi:hypothetical protein